MEAPQQLRQPPLPPNTMLKCEIERINKDMQLTLYSPGYYNVILLHTEGRYITCEYPAIYRPSVCNTSDTGEYPTKYPTCSPTAMSLVATRYRPCSAVSQTFTLSASTGSTDFGLASFSSCFGAETVFLKFRRVAFKAFSLSSGTRP